MIAGPRAKGECRVDRAVIEGKTTKDENFPVGSWLLPADVRPHVIRFYAFARAADDIADSPTLTREAKLAGLAGVEAALGGREPTTTAEQAAADLAADLGRTGVTPLYARQLLQAFTRDARNDPTRSWSDLLTYCRFSAAPVGRFLIDSHGEAARAYTASDALCAALQILNHLQDIKDDYRLRKRVYLPRQWLKAEGSALEELGADRASPALRRVIDRTLDGVDTLLVTARPLPALIARRGFRAEAAVIVVIAERLARRLRRRDPLARRVALSRIDHALCALVGLARAFL
jgi:squalene synthase HpnC